MTRREQIKALQEEIAKLRARVVQLEAIPAVQHHHHYPPTLAPVPQPAIQPFPITPFTSPNVCQGQSLSGLDPSRITVWN